MPPALSANHLPLLPDLNRPGAVPLASSQSVTQIPKEDAGADAALNWDMIRDIPPHKVFLWDEYGRYVDFSFPNPIYGHFFGPARLKGAMVADILPSDTAQAILSKIRHTIFTQAPGFLSLVFHQKGQRTFQTIIRFFPLTNHVLGLVNDFPHLTLAPSDPLPSTPAPTHLPRLRHPLTYREQQILRAVGQGLSNEAISTNLRISPRTVKFHLLNLYQKLGVSSRISLKTIAPFLLSPPKSTPH